VVSQEFVIDCKRERTMSNEAQRAVAQAQTCRQAGDRAGALRVLRRAAKRSPKDVQILYALGLELEEQEQNKQSATILRRAVQLSPDSAELLNALGNAEQAAHGPEVALECYQRAEKLAPDSAMVQLNIGDMLRRIGQPDAAQEHLLRGLALDPQALTAHYHLAIIALESGDAARGLVHLEQWAVEAPYQPQGLALKAAALKMLGRVDEAAALLDHERFVSVRQLAAPAGYSDMTTFNRELESHILKQRLTANPFSASTRGGRHGEELLSDPTGPVAGLKNILQAAFGDYIQKLPVERNHPFLASRSAAVRLVAQANILDSTGYLESHVHPQSWVSGAYYVRVPSEVDESVNDDEHAGWLSFGLFPRHIRLEPAFEVRYLKPVEGTLVIFPAYFYHGTVPFRSAKHRMSLGIDVIPKDQAG
jgi:Tfp pilus assembly protein PilF